MLKRNSLKVHWNLELLRPLLPCIPHTTKLLSSDIMEVSSLKHLCGQFYNLLCIPAFYPRSVWQKQRLIVLFTSDVMYKKYKRLVYTPLDLLARFCKINLSNVKNSAWFCFPRMCSPGLLYCDQEPLRLMWAKMIAIHNTPNRSAKPKH